MLPKLIEELALDIAAIRDAREKKAFGVTEQRSKKLIEKDIEAWIASLLESIKKRMPDVSSTLYSTVDRSFSPERTTKARAQLQHTS